MATHIDKWQADGVTAMMVSYSFGGTARVWQGQLLDSQEEAEAVEAAWQHDQRVQWVIDNAEDLAEAKSTTDAMAVKVSDGKKAESDS